MNPEVRMPALPAPKPLPAPSEAALSPKVRAALLGLTNSRLALRTALMPAPAPASPPRRAPSAWARLWWRRLRHWPAGRVAGELAQQWWHRHPWRPVGDTLIGETRSLVWPWVRRHPWWAVGAAAAVGAGLAAAKPWRWSWVDRQVRRAPSVASSFLMAQLSSAPVQAALAALLALAVQRQASADAPTAPPVQEPPDGDAPRPDTGPAPAPVREPQPQPNPPVREPQTSPG